MKKRSKKTGLPPGSLIHVGEESGSVTLTATRFNENELKISSPKTMNECLPEDGFVTWINIAGVHDPEIIHAVGKAYKLHPLTQEDVMNTDHLAKIDFMDDYIFIVAKHVECVNGALAAPAAHQVNLILGQNWVLSFQETPTDVFEPIRTLLKTDRLTFAKHGAGYLLYRLLDIVVDNFFCALEKIDEAIDSLEDETTLHQDERHMRNIQVIRRQVIFVRRAAWPMREVINMLQKKESSLISHSDAVYFSDIYDHTVQIIDTTETFREVLSNIFDIYLSGVSNRVNEVMKVLTIMATIMMPLTVVTGIYGMNFEYIPETQWHYGYFATIAAMIAITVGMLVYFKKKKWF